ncbi:hypothetical protein ACF0H5_015084 [Mactra antiquata]
MAILKVNYQIVLFIGIFLSGVFTDTNVCNSASLKGPAILPDPDDCASFYICHSGLDFKFSCATKVGPNKVFDPKSRTCVLQGSEYDHSACNRPTFLGSKCIPGMVMKLPHEDSCAKYYQCTGSIKPIKAECPYPRLFDTKSGECKIYMFVKCGARKEPKDPCEYDSNQCDDSGCIPCRQRFGTCIGYPDGPNQWEDKPWTPHFVICKDQRVILHGDCRKSGKVNIFNPVTRTCMSMSGMMKMAGNIFV